VGELACCVLFALGGVWTVVWERRMRETAALMLFIQSSERLKVTGLLF
jgi:hypothetical protein